jgi:hypothetical protein
MKKQLVDIFKRDDCPIFFPADNDAERLAEYICSNLQNNEVVTNNWIFCGDKNADRLPKNCDQVLVTRYNSKLKFSIVEIDSYNGYGGWINDKNYYKDVWIVMAWQPLPKPII